jgi:hypothetical protein
LLEPIRFCPGLGGYGCIFFQGYNQDAVQSSAFP